MTGSQGLNQPPAADTHNRRNTTMKDFRLWLLSATILGATLFTSGLIWKGYAGIEPPPGTEAIPHPRIQGKFIAMFDTVQKKAAITIVGKCKDESRYILGPVFFNSFPPEFFDPENLEGAFINVDLLGVPPGCFSASDVIVGYVVDQV